MGNLRGISKFKMRVLFIFLMVMTLPAFAGDRPIGDMLKDGSLIEKEGSVGLGEHKQNEDQEPKRNMGDGLQAAGVVVAIAGEAGTAVSGSSAWEVMIVGGLTLAGLCALAFSGKNIKNQEQSKK